MNEARIQWTVIADILVTCSTAGEIPDDVWKHMVADVRKNRVTKALGTSLGQTSISSVQRKELSEIARMQGIRLVTITDDKVVRGIITALTWLGVNISGFPWSKIQEGIVSLGVPPHLQERVLSAAQDLRRQVESGR